MANQSPDPNARLEDFMVGDPYHPIEVPAEEATDGEQEEDPEEYQPYGNFDEDDEDVQEDAQQEDDSEESAGSKNDGEVSSPPSPTSPRVPPHSRGKSPLILEMAPGRITPHIPSRTFHYAPLPFRGPQEETVPRFETGESSQAPPPRFPETSVPALSLPDSPTPVPEVPIPVLPIPAPLAPAQPIVAPPPNFPTNTHFNRVVNRVSRLEEREVMESDAIQTLYYRMGASRTHANTMGAHIRSLEYRLEIAESMLSAARREIRDAEIARIEAAERYNELVRYVRRRLD